MKVAAHDGRLISRPGLCAAGPARPNVAAAEAALLAAGVDPFPPITPVLCFVDGDWPLFAPPDVFRGVRLEGPRSLRKQRLIPNASGQPG